MQTVKLKCETLYTLAYGSVSSSYSLLGQILNPSSVYFVQNLTDVILTFSFDGIHDNFQLPPNGFLLLDVGTNHGTAQFLCFQEGTSLYVKGSPSMQQVNLTSFYMG